MCLAIPMKLVERREFEGTAELRGVRRQVGLMLCPEAAVGDFVLVHAGYAIGTVDADEAEKTLRLFDELAEAQAQEELER
jgi:hydrogenase expression/formation protein HypC